MNIKDAIKQLEALLVQKSALERDHQEKLGALDREIIQARVAVMTLANQGRKRRITPHTITELEREMLLVIRNTGYRDKRKPMKCPVLVEDVCCDYGDTRTACGVMSSLVKKGMINTNGETVAFTRRGVKASAAL